MFYRPITAQPSSLPVPMSVANWPPMGYVAPLQGVISMDGGTMSSAPIQVLFLWCLVRHNLYYSAMSVILISLLAAI